MAVLRALIATFGSAALLAVSVAGAAPADAAVVPTTANFVGDLTGDNVPDRITLATDTSTPGAPCVARVQPGRTTGGFASADFFPLPVRSYGLLVCPDLGVVVRGRTPGQNRLAVAFSAIAPQGASSVQFFTYQHGFHLDGGFYGEDEPSFIGTVDADGDGYGDVYEATDQGSGFALYVGRRSSYSVRYRSTPSSYDQFAFADFDHGKGTDVVDSHNLFGDDNVGVTVVDGATGAKVTLLTDRSDDPSSYAPTVVDLNHDGWPDIRVAVTGSDGSARPSLAFCNAATGKLAFRPCSPS